MPSPSFSSLSPSTAPVVTGTGPNFSLGELQGHLAYDLNPASTGMRRTLPSTSSSGYVAGPHLWAFRDPSPTSFWPQLIHSSSWNASFHSPFRKPLLILQNPAPSASFPCPDTHSGLESHRPSPGDSMGMKTLVLAGVHCVTFSWSRCVCLGSLAGEMGS